MLVFVDSNVFKHAAVALPRFFPRVRRLRRGCELIEVVVHDLCEVNPLDRLPKQSAELQSEASLLPRIADLAKSNSLRLTTHIEVKFELMGMPNLDSNTGILFGAPVEALKGFSSNGRIVMSPCHDFYELRDQYLSGISDQRYKELCGVVTGGGGAKGRKRSNQLADAFFLWCAERAKCAYFLTLDFILIKQIRAAKSLQLRMLVVKPSELLLELAKDET